jgi:hypothetical protein
MRAKELIVLALFSALTLGAHSARAGQQTPAPAGDAKKAESPDEKKSDEKKSDPLKPFSEIVKDARVIPGLFTLYRSEEKTFLEILPAQLDKIYMLSLTCDSGIGERGFYAAAMCGETAFVFHREGKNIQMIARNTRFTARPELPIRRAVERSFSDSVLGMAKIESQPHPERKSQLIDLGAILLTDLPMMAYDLEATFRIPYRFDAKNSYFGKLNGYTQNTEIETVAHYSVERPPLPPLPAPGATPPPMPPPPRNLPDVRSMFFRLRYSLSDLPETGYRPRLADDRVGHFFVQREDYSDDVEYSTRQRFVNRWHLEKQDPTAALSRPKQPIVFWLENTIPVKYRDAIRKGVLMYNKAFERVGFLDAIEVKQQPDDADWDPGDVRYNTIRWLAGHPDPGFAQGPSRTNPFTGQIYDADIRFSESMTRYFRREVNEGINPVAMSWETGAPKPFMAPWSSGNAQAFCDYADGKARDAEFGFDLMVARGMDPLGPDAEKFIRDLLTEIAAHEVGHTLGLRHNFRASTIHTFEQAQNPEVTAREGLTGSVMDYIPTNIAARGAKQGEFHQTTLGPYDYWAIEYAYKPIQASSPAGELPELRKIASRVADPKLAYGTDEDAGFGPGLDMDPTVNRFDLGSDPMKYYKHRTGLAQEIVANMEERLLKPGDGYQVLRRSFNAAFGQAGQALYLASKYIGGVHYYRDHVGDPGNRLPFNPVPADKQKEALNLLRDNLFSPEAFKFSPRLLNKLAGERFPDWYNFQSMQIRTDVPIHSLVLSLQRGVLDRVFHPVVMSRILDTEVKVDSPKDALTLGTLFTTIQDAVWAEARGSDTVSINSYRRALQREHLRRLIGMVLRDSSVPEDARTLSRDGLETLRGQLLTARERAAGSLETRAHLAESVARIDEALKASMQRTAF